MSAAWPRWSGAGGTCARVEIYTCVCVCVKRGNDQVGSNYVFHICTVVTTRQVLAYV